MSFQKPTFYFNSSLLRKAFCPRKFILTSIYGYTTSEGFQNYKAGYGTAGHKALQIYYETNNQDKAIAGALTCYENYVPYISEKPDEFRTPIHLECTLKAYFNHYKNDYLKPCKLSEDRSTLETKFALPFISTEFYDIVLCGTMDMLCNYNNELTLMDHKFTGSRDKIEFLHDYDMSVQSLLYIYVLYKMTNKILPFVLNGIFIKKPTQKSLIYDGVTFQRSNKILYTINQLINFENWLRFQIFTPITTWLDTHIKDLEKAENSTLQNFSSCKDSIYRCPFFLTCSLPLVNHEFTSILQASFKQIIYNPLTIHED